MRSPYNDQIFKDRRRNLRKNQTEAEEILWQKIRNKKLGVKFYRQYSISPYILDFYCPRARLAIELDGPIHTTTDRKIYDKERTGFLESIGIRVIRFRNEEVVSDVENVTKKIHNSSLPLLLS